MKLVKEKVSFKNKMESWNSFFCLLAFYSICLTTGLLTKEEEKAHHRCDLTPQHRTINWSKASWHDTPSFLEVSSSIGWTASITTSLHHLVSNTERPLFGKTGQLIRNHQQMLFGLCGVYYHAILVLGQFDLSCISHQRRTYNPTL